MRCAMLKRLLILSVVILNALPAFGLEVDARALGFTFTAPKGWAVRPLNGRGLLAMDGNRKTTISAIVLNGFDGHIGDFQVIALEGLRRTGTKVQITGTSTFKTASNTAGLRSSADVKTKDGQLHKASFFFFEIKSGTMLFLDCSGPPDGSYQAAMDSIVKTLRITG
jgi:hypothetical protein